MHKIYGKFELGIYNDSKKIFTGGSYRTTVILTGNDLQDSDIEIIKNVSDYFDHSFLFNTTSQAREFIELTTERFIRTHLSLNIPESVISKLIYVQLNEIMEEFIPRGDLKIEKIILEKDFSDTGYELVDPMNTITSEEYKEILNSLYFNTPIFNT